MIYYIEGKWNGKYDIAIRNKEKWFYNDGENKYEIEERHLRNEDVIMLIYENE